MLTQQKEILFTDREDAGKKLGEFLKKDYENEYPLILGIPRGGIEIAYYVAEKLDADFSVIVAKKLGFPDQEELAFGAMAEDGSTYLSALGKARLNKEVIERVKEAQSREINRRIKTYRAGKPLPDMKNRTVIIVDDGIATGSTLVPVIELCRKRGASKIVVAAPVSPSSSLDLLDDADEIKILAQPYPFYAVGQFYQDFRNLDDEDVFRFLKENERKEL